MFRNIFANLKAGGLYSPKPFKSSNKSGMYLLSSSIEILSSAVEYDGLNGLSTTIFV